jgi:photosystem II stability/assembly factor-like uncharacterized protein
VIYVAGGNGVLKTKNSGLVWRLCTDWRVTEVQDIEVSGLDSMWVTAGTAYGVFVSRDGAQTWEERNHGLETLFCSALEMDAVCQEQLWVGTENGIYISRDRGMQWERTEGVSVAVRSLVQCPLKPELLLAGTEDEGVYRSEDGGMTWIPSSKGMEGVTVYDIAFDPNDQRKVYAGTHGKGVYFSRNSGRSWRNLSKGLVNRVVHSVCVWPLKDDPWVFAGTVNGGIYRWEPDREEWVFSGLDGAQVWEIEVHRFQEGE